jgi:large subunit ribosomal protein L24e
VRWTKAFRKSHGKELTMDATFEFEKKRNVPMKYSREVWSSTVKAIKKVERIKAKRQGQFIKNRSVLIRSPGGGVWSYS